MKRIILKEIPFGTPIDDPDGYCIYANGHIEAAPFVAAVKVLEGCEVPKDVREELTVSDVEYIRFRPMSPTEARRHGLTSGVLEVSEGGYAGEAE